MFAVRREVRVTASSIGASARTLLTVAVVDADAIHFILPATWRERLGTMVASRRMEQVTASAGVLRGDVCGPVLLRIEDFRPVCTEVLFAEQFDGHPILGRLPIAQIPARFDLTGQLVQDRIRV